MEKNIFAVISRSSFEYDVNSIVKAFYPDRQVKVVTEESVSLRKEYQEAKQSGNTGYDEILITLGDDGAQMEMRVEGWNPKFYGAVYEWQFSPRKAAVPETDRTREADYKAGFKTFLYKTLEAHTGKSLPWGNLTGIRPTKIAYGLLEEGKTPEEIREFLKKNYFVSGEKAGLSIDIAAREREILRGIHYQGGYSLYIGIPFCPTTCLYCSFTSFPIAIYRKKVEAYIDCLIQEMAFVAEAYGDKILDTVYIGGGTPTTL